MEISRTKKNEMLKEKTTLAEEGTKHLDEQMDCLDEQISMQKEILKLHETNYTYYEYTFYSTIEC